MPISENQKLYIDVVTRFPRLSLWTAIKLRVAGMSVVSEYVRQQLDKGDENSADL